MDAICYAHILAEVVHWDGEVIFQVIFQVINVSFCIFNIIVNSSLEYFSLVLNTIPRRTM